MKKIGYLGPPGTFSEIAARRYVKNSGIEMVCLPSFLEILSSVESRKLDVGILPIENSTEGSVNQTLDLLAHRFKKIKIKGEIILPIAHKLMARPGIKLNEITKVISHPQALAQCREYVERFLPQAVSKEAISTAEAASTVAKTQQPWAAIGTALVAQLYNLIVLAENINDYPDNATRFIVVGLEDAAYCPDCKTSLIISLKDKPGALYNILKEFALREINLTRIESRPAKSKLGDYLFFIDLEGHRQDSPVKEALREISRQVVYMRILGSYPAEKSFLKGQK